MPTTTITLSAFTNGLATDVTSVKLQDSANAYGLKRTDTGDIVEAAGTDVPRISPGTYQLSIADPADDLTYDYVIQVVYGGNTYYYPRVAGSGGSLNHFYAIPSSAHYSSQAEVMRWLGDPACEMMVEDWDNTDSSPLWNQILATVDARINAYVAMLYAPAAILSNALIRGHASILSAHFLSIRRGNPGLYLREVERVYESLEAIRNGSEIIYGAIPLGDRRPVVRNYLMQPFSYHPMRVIQTKSTGATYGREDYAWEPYMYFW